MTFLENLQTGKYNCILFTLIFIILFHSYWTKPECMTDTPAVSTTAINDAIKAVYVADVAAIRNLSNIATQLTSANGLTIPGPVSMNGGVNTGKITNNSTESFCIYSNSWIDLRTKSGIHIRNDDGSGYLWADGNIKSDSLNVVNTSITKNLTVNETSTTNKLVVNDTTTTKNLTVTGTLTSGGGAGTYGQYLVSTGPTTPPQWISPFIIIPWGDGNSWGKKTNGHYVNSQLFPAGNFSTINCISGNLYYKALDGSGDDYLKTYFVVTLFDSNDTNSSHTVLHNGSDAGYYNPIKLGSRSNTDVVYINLATWMINPNINTPNKFIQVSMVIDKNTDDNTDIKWTNIVFLLA